MKDYRLHINHNADTTQVVSAVFNNYFNSLYNYALRLTQNKEIAKDSIQELFLRIWKNKIDLLSINNLKAYLFKGIRHQIINILELKCNRTEQADIEETFVVEFSPEDYFINNQTEENTRKKIIHALNQLTKKQREVIYLRYFEELDYEDIARIMHINIQSVKNNLQRSYVPLKFHLQ
jgi:RNA polymerase sigma factor (sigma-70 family)